METRVNLIRGIIALKVFAVGLVFNLLVLIALAAVKADRGTTQSTHLTTNVVGQLHPTGRKSGPVLTPVTAESRPTTTPRLLLSPTRGWMRRKRSNRNNNNNQQ